jgi:hypothetical protein
MGKWIRGRLRGRETSDVWKKCPYKEGDRVRAPMPTVEAYVFLSGTVTGRRIFTRDDEWHVLTGRGQLGVDEQVPQLRVVFDGHGDQAWVDCESVEPLEE